jgi:hypothetical protein
MSPSAQNFRVGQNVKLVGPLASSAISEGFYDIVTIAGSDPSGNPIIILYKPAPPGTTVAQGGIGTRVAQTTVPVAGIKPLPYLLENVSADTLESNVRNLACRNINRNNPWGCASCDPSGRTFDQNEWTSTYENTFATITNTQKGGPGSIYFYMFQCPSTVVREGSRLSGSNPSCNKVVFASVRNSDGTNRYNFVSIVDSILIQEAFLITYNMPVSVEYFNALPWSSIPQYVELKNKIEGERIVCEEIDNVWLSSAITDLLSRGFALSQGNLTISR